MLLAAQLLNTSGVLDTMKRADVIRLSLGWNIPAQLSAITHAA